MKKLTLLLLLLSLIPLSIYAQSGSRSKPPTRAQQIKIKDVGDIIAGTNVETALQENRTAIDLNTAKTTNATHTGEVTGSGALTLDPTAISNKADTTIVAADHLLFFDATDNALKKVGADELLGGGAPEGTAVLSTGEGGGTKFLREDGDGTCSWQAPAGGGDLLADGTIPLTANWDVGAFTITGTQFISDIAGGTAPFVVTSTTEVANLKAATAGNADTVTTNANLTGEVTSVGNAATIADSITVTGWVLGTSSATQITSPTLITDLIDTTGAADIDYGSIDVTDHTFITDGTGTAEIVLPAGSIDGTEILDDTIDSSDYAADSIDNEHINWANISNLGDNGACTLSATVTNATFTTALTVDTGTVGLTGNVANNSVLTLGAGASSVSGANTGDGTYAKDLVATSPITVNAGTNVDNILVGADSDITIAMPAATNATAGHASAAHITAIEANTTHAADNTQAHSDYFINSGSDIAGGGSGFTWGFNASAGSDPVITFGDGIINVSTGELQEGGVAVLTAEVDGSTTNEINTITCPDTNVTAGLGITLAESGPITITEAADTVTFTVTEVDPTVDTQGEIEAILGYGFDDTPEGADYDVVFTGNGLMTRTAASTYTSRTIAGTANEITMTNGDGIAGNPTIAIHADIARDVELPTNYVTNDAADTIAGALTINPGTFFIKEQADASADVAGQGQIWVNTATPNELWWTDDAGTDTQLGLGGAEVNNLETVCTNIADTEVFVGTGANAGAYITGLAACAADEKIEYVPGSPDTFTCEAIGGLVDGDISNTLTASTSTLAAANDNDTSIATTSFVQQEINGAGGTDLSCSGGQCNVDNPVTAATTASNLAADGVDALTEIAQAIKSANNDTSLLVVGTAGSNGEIAKWNTDGTLTDNNVILGTMTDGKWCSYTAAGTLLSCTQNSPGSPATADISDVSVTQTELAELETIGVTTISANQWAALGSIAETLSGTELSLLDGITVLSGSNTGDNTVATTGDSATAFFAAGEIEHERGGLEADVNAYTGLVGINAGATSEVDTEAELETHLGGLDVVTVTADDISSANLKTLLSDESGTGAAIFAGGALAAATATTPAADDNDTSVATTAYVQGEINGAGGRSLTCSSGSCAADVETYVARHAIAFEDPVATDDFFFGEVSKASTWTSIYCKTLVGTCTLDVQIAGVDINGSDITCNTTGVLDEGLGGDTAGAVGEEVKLAITSVASSPTYLMVILNGTYND